MQIQLGNLAEWLAAAGSIAALLLALLVLKGELVARREEQEDRRLRYAGGVTAWLEEEVVYEGEPPEHYIVNQYWRAFVTNAGQTPVYKSVLWVGPTGRKRPHDDRIRLEVGVLAPGQTREEHVARGWLENGSEPFVELEFTDSTSRSWRRLADGALKPIARGRADDT